ncbi:MAG: hypothetical protein SFV23_22155 [Planctomycetaceae bacterium]|nr:hypothetical protein [Planctomycetaceae bacterium]
MNRGQRRLALLLRVIGVLDLLAFAAMLQPVSWLSAIHAALQMGTFPEVPVAIYLVRSSSMLYGLCGTLLLFLSSDVARYAPAIRFIARVGLLAGGILIGIDVASRMPWWWIAVEGPACALLWGLVWGAGRESQLGANQLERSTAATDNPA